MLDNEVGKKRKGRREGKERGCRGRERKSQREGGRAGIRVSRRVEMERCLILKSKHLTQHTSMTDETVDEVL